MSLIRRMLFGSDAQPPPWARTVEEYLDGSVVVAPMRRSGGDLKDFALVDGSYPYHRVTRHAPGYAFHFGSSTFFKIVDQSTGEPVGAFLRDHAFVRPDHRGRGLMAELYCMLDTLGIRRDSWVLTPSSFGARKGAHRRHVERAVAAGRPVPQRVLSQYETGEDGRMRLRSDYTAGACNRRKRERDQQARLSVMRPDVGAYAESFLPDGPEDAISRYLARDHTDHMGGLRLAGRIAAAVGGAVRLTVSRAEGSGEVRALAFQAQLGEDVIDHAGVRGAGAAIADLEARGRIARKDHKTGEGLRCEVMTFPGVAECLAWVRSSGYREQRAMTREESEDLDRSCRDLAARAATWATRDAPQGPVAAA